MNRHRILLSQKKNGAIDIEETTTGRIFSALQVDATSTWPFLPDTSLNAIITDEGTQKRWDIHGTRITGLVICDNITEGDKELSRYILNQLSS